ncbi:hypothetical protein PsorP6_002479 [Peronosclerospora sorghi]|uniref:Uncharacterized protein n=1 Tax=Peronosclerospora sorghi TaxID=230839 RepID=A0ACC0WWU6_9STRA|nr:hypothetical protein PsorP6_002479 [Peronosclerospora sorghi]
MGSNKRRHQRVKAVGAQVEENIEQDGEEKKLKHVNADQLYQVDNKGGNVPAALTKKQKLDKLQNDPLLASTRKFNASNRSKSEIMLVKKLQKQQDYPINKLAQENKMKTVMVKELWSEDGSIIDNEQNHKVDDYVAPVVVKKTSRRKVVAPTKYKEATVEVAAAGQSYHPDFDAHQDVLAEAVAEELQRRVKRAQLQEPVQGMSEETLQFIKQESSDSETGSSDSEDKHDMMTTTHKLPEKLTRAQRNKRLRHKQTELKQRMRSHKKAISKQINASSHILQEIVKCEKEMAKSVELKKLQKEQKLNEEPPVRVAGKYIKLDRTMLFSLSEELTGNYRTLKPKGNPLLDRFDSLHKRNQIEIGRPKKTRKAKVKIIETK